DEGGRPVRPLSASQARGRGSPRGDRDHPGRGVRDRPMSLLGGRWAKASTGGGRSPMFRSLRLRMALSHGAVLAAIVVALGTAGYALLSRSLDRQATATLTQAA